MGFLTKLITAIIFHIKKSGSYVTKTKLLKLLYLVDVEYYRLHRKLLTEFNWKYYHLGPWTAEYDTVLESLIACDAIIKTRNSNSESDTEFYYTKKEIKLEDVFEDVKDELMVKRILDIWGTKTTNEILDYVYFYTEPMIYGERNKALDFSKIPEQKSIIYAKAKSGKSQQEIKALRQEFKRKQEEKKQGEQTQLEFTAPKYDEEYSEAMEKLEELYR